jgi:hypothetical protein
LLGRRGFSLKGYTRRDAIVRRENKRKRHGPESKRRDGRSSARKRRNVFAVSTVGELEAKRAAADLAYHGGVIRRSSSFAEAAKLQNRSGAPERSLPESGHLSVEGLVAHGIGKRHKGEAKFGPLPLPIKRGSKTSTAAPAFTLNTRIRRESEPGTIVAQPLGHGTDSRKADKLDFLRSAADELRRAEVRRSRHSEAHLERIMLPLGRRELYARHVSKVFDRLSTDKSMQGVLAELLKRKPSGKLLHDPREWEANASLQYDATTQEKAVIGLLLTAAHLVADPPRIVPKPQNTRELFEQREYDLRHGSPVVLRKANAKNAPLTAYLRALTDETWGVFGSPLYGAVAKIASIALDRTDITDRTVRSAIKDR